MPDKPTYLTDPLYDYLLAHTPAESNTAKALREKTETLPNARMQTSPDAANFLKLLVLMQNAKRILELGTFTGYATLHLAEALNGDGKVVTCEINAKIIEIAKPFWQQAKVDSLIEVKLAPAEETLTDFINEKTEPFDFIFIDANKSKYLTYYELCLSLLKPKGIMVIDNVLAAGKIIDTSLQDNMLKTVRKLNDTLMKDARVKISMLPIYDGMTVVWKRP